MSVKKLVDALSAHRAWSHLPQTALEKAAKAFLDQGTLVEVTGGEVIASLLEPQDVCWMVLLGSVDEWSTERRLAIRGPGELTGELSVLAASDEEDEVEDPLEIVAREDGLLLCIEGDTLREMSGWLSPFTPILLKEVARHGLSWAKPADEGLYTLTDQVYPWTNPSIFPAPYQANQAELYYIPCTVDPDQMAAFCAPNVAPTDFFWLVIARYTGGVGLGASLQNQVAHYDEICIMVPATLPNPWLGMYMPWIYVGSASAMVTGREVFGYPKTLYSTIMDMNCLGLEDQSRAVLWKDGRAALTAVWKEISWQEATAEGRSKLADLVFDPMHDGGDTGHNKKAMNYAADPTSKRLIAHMNTWQPKVAFGTWKRSFAPSTGLPGTPLVKWNPSQFQVDGVAESLMALQQISAIDFIVVTDLQSDPNFIAPGMEAFPILSAFGMTLGFKLTCDFAIEPGSGMLTDYLSDPPTDSSQRRKLNWGPGAWSPLLTSVAAGEE